MIHFPRIKAPKNGVLSPRTLGRASIAPPVKTSCLPPWTPFPSLPNPLKRKRWIYADDGSEGTKRKFAEIHSVYDDLRHTEDGRLAQNLDDDTM